MSEEMKNLYGVNLLIALLTRLPELDAVEYRGATEQLGLSIDIRPKENAEALFDRFEEQFGQIIKAYSQLEEVVPLKTNAEISPLGAGWWQFMIWVSIKEVQLSFLLLLVSWWRDFLQDCEFNSNRSLEKLGEDEKSFQEEMIENMLQVLQNEGLEISLKGLRENHQIVVFQKKVENSMNI